MTDGAIQEKVLAPYESYLDRYTSYKINDNFQVGELNYVFRNNILYLIKDNEEVKIGDLKLNFVDNIANGDPLQRYTFKENGEFYYISGDSLYRIDKKLIHFLNFQ